MKDKEHIIFALAPSYMEFSRFCLNAHLAASEFKYIRSVQDIRGYADCNLWIIGYTDREPDILDYCKSHNIEVYRPEWK